MQEGEGEGPSADVTDVDAASDDDDDEVEDGEKCVLCTCGSCGGWWLGYN